ncbi:hypothetical protein KIPB_007458, partial [Kipferlia bialata]
ERERERERERESLLPVVTNSGGEGIHVCAPPPPAATATTRGKDKTIPRFTRYGRETPTPTSNPLFMCPGLAQGMGSAAMGAYQTFMSSWGGVSGTDSAEGGRGLVMREGEMSEPEADSQLGAFGPMSDSEGMDVDGMMMDQMDMGGDMMDMMMGGDSLPPEHTRSLAHESRHSTSIAPSDMDLTRDSSTRDASVSKTPSRRHRRHRDPASLDAALLVRQRGGSALFSELHDNMLRRDVGNLFVNALICTAKGGMTMVQGTHQGEIMLTLDE